jgi:hypothetical protein
MTNVMIRLRVPVATMLVALCKIVRDFRSTLENQICGLDPRLVVIPITNRLGRLHLTSGRPNFATALFV